MKTIEFSTLEKQMISFDFNALNAHKEKAKANIASARDIADVKAEICSVWSKIRQYVIWAENIPVAGKFITILADLLDSICGAG